MAVETDFTRICRGNSHLDPGTVGCLLETWPSEAPEYGKEAFRGASVELLGVQCPQLDCCMAWPGAEWSERGGPKGGRGLDRC